MKSKSTGKRKLPAIKSRRGPAVAESMDFPALVDAIQRIHEQSAADVNRVVNTTVTLRNWIIGAYIVEYEMRGADRAKYGEGLLDRLAERLTENHVPSCERRRLYVYRQFFNAYPQIVESLSPLFPGACRIMRSATALSGNRLKTGGAHIVRSVTAQLALPAKTLLNSLSYTHFEQLLALDDPLKRAFYEIECIRGNWSVRQLKRQIATLYFERSGLSRDKEKLAAMVKAGAETAEPKLAIRDPYIFEFLGLRAKDAVAETDLEAALVENLRDSLKKSAANLETAPRGARHDGSIPWLLSFGATPRSVRIALLQGSPQPPFASKSATSCVRRRGNTDDSPLLYSFVWGVQRCVGREEGRRANPPILPIRQSYGSQLSRRRGGNTKNLGLTRSTRPVRPVRLGPVRLYFSTRTRNCSTGHTGTSGSTTDERRRQCIDALADV